MKGVESLCKNLIKNGEALCIVSRKGGVHNGETVLVVQNAKVALYVLITHRSAAEGHRLVKDGEGVTHCAIGLGGYHVKGFVVYGYAFLFRYSAQVFHHIGDADTVEVVGLAAAEYGGEYLVLFRCGQDEDGVCRGLFQGFEEGVEGALGQHVHLIYDVHAVLSNLGRHLHLLHKGFDVLYGVIGSGVKLMDAIAATFLEGDAGFALPAGLHIRPGIGAVYHLCKDTSRGGLTHAAGPAEKVCVRQLPSLYGV